jgi:hypothetical protein
MGDDITKPAQYVVASQQTDLVIEHLQKIDPTTHKTQFFAVKDFYKPEKVAQALKAIADNSLTKAGDYGEIIKALQAHQEAVLGFYNAITKDDKLQLKREVYKLPSVDDTKKLATDYTKVSREYEATTTGLTALATLLRNPDLKQDQKTVKVTEYIITDPDSLTQELNNTNRLTITISGMVTPTTTNVKTAYNGVDVNISTIARETEKLQSKTGLDKSKYKEKHGFLWNTTVSRVLADILAEMHKRGSTTHYPNIRGDEVAIPKEVLDAGLEGLTQVKENPDLLTALDSEYRNEQERTDRGGLAIQTELFKGLLSGMDESDLAPWATVDQAIRTLNIAGTTALVACVRYLHDSPNGGDIDITDLMAYDHKYKEQKESRRGLVKSDRVAFGNSLKLLLALNWGIKTKVSDRTSRIKYYRLVNGEIEVNNETGEIISVKGLKFDNDFYDIKNKLLHVLAPKGIDYLTSPEAKSVALKVQSLFAKHQKDTIAGKPQQITREWLTKGSYKVNSRTNEIVISLLNDMVRYGLVAKWHNVKGTQVLNGYDKDTYKILLYPTVEAQESYITKDMRVAEKKAQQDLQKSRINSLKRAVKGYGSNDLLAQELGVDMSQLELWATGSEKIPDYIAEKVTGL